MEENEMNLEPLVSILVPIYKVEAYIEKCAKSLFEQTYSNIEYIFVDDCSPDNSVAVLRSVMERYSQRTNQIKIIQNIKNRGIAEVRNTLIKKAKGEYVIFVDSDDWVEVSMVENLVIEAQKTMAEIVCYDLIYEYDGYSKKYEFVLSDNKIENFKNISLGILNTYLCLLLVKRNLYIDNKLEFYMGVNLCEDYIMYNYLFFYAKRIAYHPYAYYHYYRGNPNSYTVLSIQNIKDRIKAIRVVEHFLQSVGLFSHVCKELNIRNFLTKKDFIFNSGLCDFAQWRTSFPETNFYWKYINVGLKNKVIYFLVSLRLDIFAKIFLK